MVVPTMISVVPALILARVVTVLNAVTALVVSTADTVSHIIAMIISTDVVPHALFIIATMTPNLIGVAASVLLPSFTEGSETQHLAVNPTQEYFPGGVMSVYFCLCNTHQCANVRAMVRKRKPGIM